MYSNSIDRTTETGLTLVLGGTGKTGRRVAERLIARGFPTRVGSRAMNPAFDWDDPDGWGKVLEGVTAVYIAYAPDLAVPGAVGAVQRFVDQAVASGVRRLVLLSGRGETEALRCERVIQETDAEWTVIRSSWFMQNFSEGEFVHMVRAGEITLPAADIPEPFVDIDDIADVAVAALTEEGHACETYEVTGPRMLTFTELAEEISRAAGREIRFTRIPQRDFNRAVAESGVPENVAWLLNYLFETVLDGRNAYVCDGVRRALGREAADFSGFVHRVAERGGFEPFDQEKRA